MDRAIFRERLRQAAETAVEFARRHVHQQLPESKLFLVYPNQSYDGNPLVGDEVVFPDDSLDRDQCHGPWTPARAVEFLWRSSRVPEWIDLAVQSEDGQHTHVALRCCGRFTASDELLYHHQSGIPPFSVKSPVLPPGWKSIEESGRFDLYWRQK
ncbi:MAG: hypothetical protein JNG89_19215 [Planctomycetaceae bacterium]|nr:hypothetical protein [Planctomycetaceae bacterium]